MYSILKVKSRAIILILFLCWLVRASTLYSNEYFRKKISYANIPVSGKRT